MKNILSAKYAEPNSLFDRCGAPVRYAVNPDGTELWSNALSSGSLMTDAIIDSDGTIYVGANDGKLYAVFGNSGGLADSPWPMEGRDLSRAAQQPYPELSIGDEGIAGGYIFYDDEADGTDDIPGIRYLEVAPGELPQGEGVNWGGYGTNIGGADSGSAPELTGLGDGEANTEAIVAALGENGGTSYGAKLCDDLNLNGYGDWFLPSIDELYLLYNTLGINGSGIITGGYYTYFWSSSEIDGEYAWTQYFYSSDSNPKDTIAKNSYESGVPFTHRAVYAVRNF
jgi:hypothetical protein